jgi:hypothetical protein
VDDTNDELVSAALNLFNAEIDREITDRLEGDEPLLERLDRVRLAGGALGEDLRYGQDSVTLWLRLVLASEHRPVALAEGDLEEIAQETVASAALDEHPGDEEERRVACLARCVAELEESDVLGAALVNALRLCVADVRLATQMLRRWAGTDIDVIDLVANTRRVLRRR